MFGISAFKQNDILDNEDLLDEAFGSDRLSRAAYRLRDGVSALDELSFVMRCEGELKASLRFWPVLIKDGDRVWETLLLGPIAVRADCRGQGVGLRLMTHGLTKARQLGHKRVVLIGDEAYYQKVGFSSALAVGITMPGAVDKARLLAQALTRDAMNGVTGVISKIK